MKNFDQRWQEMAAHARRAQNLPGPTTAPAGFATRILARSAANRAPAVEDLWLEWLRPALAVTTVAAAILTGLEVQANHPTTLGRPAVENTIAQVLWKL